MTTSPVTIRPLVAAWLGQQWRRSVLDDRAVSSLSEHAQLLDLDLLTTGPAGQWAVVPDLERVRVLLTGWGTPRLEPEVLDRMPALQLVAHAAGTVRHLVTDAVWERGIRVSTAAAANAVSVADFTVAQLQLSLKNAWRLAATAHRQGGPVARAGVRGLDGATIGLVGLGSVGTLVALRLSELDVRVLAHDPYASESRCARLGVEQVDLGALFARSDVVSLHAPHTEATHHMVGPEQLALLPPGATLINTARGGLVDHDALTAVLQQRPDLFALLDVTDPEPLSDGHPLHRLDNCLVTPHVAGSLGTEEARLGRLAASEAVRFLQGRPLEHELDARRSALTA